MLLAVRDWQLHAISGLAFSLGALMYIGEAVVSKDGSRTGKNQLEYMRRMDGLNKAFTIAPLQIAI
jgi:hypothetical protein